MTNSANKWTAGKHGGEFSEVIDFGLVDLKGRRIGTRLFVQPRFRYTAGLEREATGTFSYSIQSTRNGSLFGGIPREEGNFDTIEEAKAAAEQAAERSRKAQARKYGSTIEDAKAKQAERSAKSAAKTAAWLADYEARLAQRQGIVEVEPAPVAEVKAPAVVGPWGDLCRCADCLAGKNGPTTVRGT